MVNIRPAPVGPPRSVPPAPAVIAGKRRVEAGDRQRPSQIPRSWPGRWCTRRERALREGGAGERGEGGREGRGGEEKERGEEGHALMMVPLMMVPLMMVHS